MDRIDGNSRFHTTLWSVVLRAGGVEGALKFAALNQLSRLYWKPLYVYCLGMGLKPEDAEDFTQAFFARLLARDSLRVADPARGKFRSFLLTSFKHFISGERDRSRAIRRGGSAIHISFDFNSDKSEIPTPSPELSPELAYDKQWAIDLIHRATSILRGEYESAGKAEWFDRIAGSSSGAAYIEVATELNSTEEAVKSFAKRARRRFREILEREIADTVGSPDEAAEELAYLAELLRS